jgi:glutamate/tyrosine decarboxylase-like PLP-dependent enzyme
MKNQIFRKLWKDTLQLIENYIQETTVNSPVINYLPASALKEELALKLTEKGCSDEEILLEIKKILDYSPNTLHPLFNNQLSAGINFEALIGELVSAISNATMATYEVAPVATLIEQKLIDEISAKIDFGQGDGIMLTGGSNANMMAIHIARNERFPEIKHVGNSHHKICVFASREAHYSHKKAMMLMGLGLDNLIMVETDSEGSMLPSDLEAKIQKSITEDKIPLMLCSTAGTTVLGAYDPIRKNDVICKKYGLWHHVDGAWGGAVLFSKKYAHLLEGLSEVDSFTFDAHKILGTGLITSFFLTKKKDVLLKANSASGTHYLFHEYENSEYDTGRKSLQCGRKVDALKLWLNWKALGHEGMQKYVEDQFEKRNHIIKLINEHPRLKLIHAPQYLNVCFQVLPKDPETDINNYNYRLRFKTAKSGEFMVNYSSFVDGTVFFRLVLANQYTTKADLDYMVERLTLMAD